MRFSWLLICVTSAITLSSVVGPAAAADPRQPNIVFILADDLGINDLSCYGRKDQATPRLDRLAAEGQRFTCSYAACSVCSPTRAALLTGKAPARLHLTTFLPGRPDTPSQMLLQAKMEQQLPAAEQTVADRLHAAGYATACFGKWHLGGKGSLPTDRGFDKYFAGEANTKPSATEGGKGEYALTAAAMEFIKANRERPFFAYIAHDCPHIPLAAQPEKVAKHAESFNPTYAAMLETLDDCVGRVVDQIDALGLNDNTLIVFASDNGGLHVLESNNSPATHNDPYRGGKGFCYEGGTRVPTIVRWPGKIKPGVVDVPIITTDWTPTLLELASIKHNDALDGVSLAGLLTEAKPLEARPLFWHEPHYTNQGSQPGGAVRDGDWKLVEHYETGYCELFNLASDIGETKDVAAQQPARVAELRGKLEAWRRSVKAQSNEPNLEYDARLAEPLYRKVDVSIVPAAAKATEVAKQLHDWRAAMNSAGNRPKNGKPAGDGVARGTVLLAASAAKVHGDRLHYEEQPQKDTLGFWTVKDDYPEWEFDVPTAGSYRVTVLQGCGKSSGGAEVDVVCGEQKLPFKVEETGHFQRFVPHVAGVLNFAKPGRQTLSLRPQTKPGGAVMDVRRVTLTPALPQVQAK